MNEAKTAEYPVRYSAFDNPGTWVEWHEAPMTVAGSREYAAYHQPMVNRDYPHLTDGIYIEVSRWWDEKSWRMDAHATRPDYFRKQSGTVKQYATFEEAKAAAIEWLAKLQAFCATKTEHGLRRDSSTSGRCACGVQFFSHQSNEHLATQHIEAEFSRHIQRITELLEQAA